MGNKACFYCVFGVLVFFFFLKKSTFISAGRKQFLFFLTFLTKGAIIIFHSCACEWQCDVFPEGNRCTVQYVSKALRYVTRIELAAYLEIL